MPACARRPPRFAAVCARRTRCKASGADAKARSSNVNVEAHHSDGLQKGGSTDTDYAVASAELFDSTVTCSTITLGPAPMPAATTGTPYNNCQSTPANQTLVVRPKLVTLPIGTVGTTFTGAIL